MAENLTERFVDHRGIALAAKRVSEFSLHHRERRFDVRAFMKSGKSGEEKRGQEKRGQTEKRGKAGTDGTFTDFRD